MEWLEVTGKTIAQAEEEALDRLGVDRSEAEFSVVEEPKAGLLGFGRTEARIRARVQPAQPRAKQDRKRRSANNRDRNRKKKSAPGSLNENKSRGGQGKSGGANAPSRQRSERRQQQKPQISDKSREGVGGNRSPKTLQGAKTTRSKPMEDQMSLEDQSTLVVDFLDGLLEAFELDAEVYAERVEEEVMEMRVQNTAGVGLLIGPKGNTIRAIEDLSRMLVQRKSDGNCEGRIRVDIGGYRERRRAALEEFCEKIALEVCDNGVERPLEPMNAADRKVVHDVVAEIDGVRTVSDGQAPRRWVVFLPD